jgi:hypothetical protein
MRFHKTYFIGYIFLAWAGVAAAPAADFQVVASKDVEVDQISAAELKKIFLLEKSTAGGKHVTPVVLQGGAAHQAFLKECLGESDQELKDLYKDMAFTGKAVPPKTVASDAAMIAFLAMSKGAIGYVSAEAVPIGVKKIAVK